jgi:uncharacterized membrane protein
VGVAIAILALALVGAIVGTTLNFAGVFLAIPLVFIGIGFFVTREQLARQRRIAQLHRFRRQARTREHEFDEEDRRTVV